MEPRRRRDAQLQARGIVADTRLLAICHLFKDRCDTTVALADWASVFYADVHPNKDELIQHLTEDVKPALALLADKLAECVWDKAAIASTLKQVLVAFGLKMPMLAMPVRVLVVGSAHTPSLDAVLELFDREKVIERLRSA